VRFAEIRRGNYSFGSLARSLVDQANLGQAFLLSFRHSSAAISLGRTTPLDRSYLSCVPRRVSFPSPPSRLPADSSRSFRSLDVSVIPRLAYAPKPPNVRPVNRRTQLRRCPPSPSPAASFFLSLPIWRCRARFHTCTRSTDGHYILDNERYSREFNLAVKHHRSSPRSADRATAKFRSFVPADFLSLEFSYRSRLDF